MVQLNFETTIKMQAYKMKTYTDLKDSTRYHFVVIGAGGTGGHLIPNLVRQVGVYNSELGEDDIKHSVLVIDADEVERSNLIRQNFTSGDLGKNKAKVMATRYGRAFGVDVGYVESYITSPKDLILMAANALSIQSKIDIFYDKEEIAQNEAHPEDYMAILRSEIVTVFIDATDNNKTRFIIEESARRWKGEAIVLSSGNEASAGQVLFSAFPKRSTYKTFQDYWDRDTMFVETGLITSPSFFDVFPNSPFEKLPTEMSCAESTVSAPQNMIANVTASNILFNYVNKLLAFEPIQVFLTFFDTQGMTQSVYRFNKTDMTRALQLTPNNRSLATYVTGESNGDDVCRPTWSDFEEARVKEEQKKAEEISRVLAGISHS